MASFSATARLRIKHITDGTGKTFMIGERDKFCLAGTWLRCESTGWSGDSQFFMDVGPRRWIVTLNYPITAAYDTCPEGFSSAHSAVHSSPSATARFTLSVTTSVLVRWAIPRRVLPKTQGGAFHRLQI